MTRGEELEERVEKLASRFDTHDRQQWEKIAQLAEEIEKLKKELNKTWVDEWHTVWTRPTAWAYAQVCKDRDRWRGLAVAREGALERILALLGPCRLDHSGNCQEHFLSSPCEVQQAQCAIKAEAE